MGNADDDQILDIKLADLQTSAPQFLTHSSDLATALAKLQGGLAAAGSPWGGDDQGKQFEDQYVPNVTSMTMAAEILALGLARPTPDGVAVRVAVGSSGPATPGPHSGAGAASGEDRANACERVRPPPAVERDGPPPLRWPPRPRVFGGRGRQPVG
ncbi:hypothetical protein AB0399_38885 [Streptomyces sp. NPDC088194]|uniref:hypothetical protein n=1 Tax=Streptomyces sp. NPDC088194 TaxID=3154931 RepID=UPI00344DB92D